MTAQALITRAMRLIGALASGESPTATEAQDGLTILNAMVDTWATHRLTILATTRTTHTLTAGISTYPIGEDAVDPGFDQVRPVFLSGIGILTAAAPTLETPLEEMTAQDYRELAGKAESGTPTAYYYQRTQPFGYLTFSPVPDAADTVAIYWPQHTSEFYSLTAEYTLAPGYEEALLYNLAVRLCPEYTRPLDSVVASLANETLAAIKRANWEPLEMQVDPALLSSGGWSIYTGR